MFWKSSPYARNPQRLSDLVASIQVLGAYRFAGRRIEKWEKRLGRRPVSAKWWLDVFKQHPEFFTIDGENIYLTWRRSRERNYDTFEHRLLSKEEAEKMALTDNESAEKRLTRPPLESSEIAKLVDIAIGMHERELSHQQERRWWLTAVIAAAGIAATLLARV